MTEIITVSSIEDSGFVGDNSRVSKRFIKDDLVVDDKKAEIIHSNLKRFPPRYRRKAYDKMKEIGYISPDLITSSIITGIMSEISKRVLSILWPKKNEIEGIGDLQKNILQKVTLLPKGRCHIAGVMAKKYFASHKIPAILLKGDVYHNGKRIVKNHAFLIIKVNGKRYLYDPTIKLFVPSLPIFHPISKQT